MRWVPSRHVLQQGVPEGSVEQAQAFVRTSTKPPRRTPTEQSRLPKRLGPAECTRRMARSPPVEPVHSDVRPRSTGGRPPCRVGTSGQGLSPSRRRPPPHPVRRQPRYDLPLRPRNDHRQEQQRGRPHGLGGVPKGRRHHRQELHPYLPQLGADARRAPRRPRRDAPSRLRRVSRGRGSLPRVHALPCPPSARREPERRRRAHTSRPRGFGAHDGGRPLPQSRLPPSREPTAAGALLVDLRADGETEKGVETENGVEVENASSRRGEMAATGGAA